MKKRTWEPGMDRTFGLEHEGSTKTVIRELEASGFGYVELSDDWMERRHQIARSHAALRTLRRRFAPVPVQGQTVRRDFEGDGPYFMYSLGGEKPVFK